MKDFEPGRGRGGIHKPPYTNPVTRKHSFYFTLWQCNLNIMFNSAYAELIIVPNTGASVAYHPHNNVKSCSWRGIPALKGVCHGVRLFKNHNWHEEIIYHVVCYH